MGKVLHQELLHDAVRSVHEVMLLTADGSEADLAALGLTLQTAHALWAIDPAGAPPTMKAVADHLHCHPSNLTFMTKELERRGLPAMLERTQARARQRGHRWWLLVRRNLKTGEMAYYLCFSGRPVSLAALVAVASRRWAIEESFQASKGLTGLDEHQVRRWTSWRRWTLLVMAAHAVLAIATLTARERDREVARREGLIPLTCAEIRRLVVAAARRAVDVAFVEAWSYWRRRHQNRARTSHYAARGQLPPAK